jgi:hypothetical protein
LYSSLSELLVVKYNNTIQYYEPALCSFFTLHSEFARKLTKNVIFPVSSSRCG